MRVSSTSNVHVLVVMHGKRDSIAIQQNVGQPCLYTRGLNCVNVPSPYDAKPKQVDAAALVRQLVRSLAARAPALTFSCLLGEQMAPLLLSCPLLLLFTSVLPPDD